MLASAVSHFKIHEITIEVEALLGGMLDLYSDVRNPTQCGIVKDMEDTTWAVRYCGGVLKMRLKGW